MVLFNTKGEKLAELEGPSTNLWVKWQLHNIKPVFFSLKNVFSLFFFPVFSLLEWMNAKIE